MKRCLVTGLLFQIVAGAHAAGLTVLAPTPTLGVSRDLFPEERKPEKWDRGCADWPLELSGEKTLFSRNPEMRIEKGEGFFRVFAQVIFRPERNETLNDVIHSIDEKLGRGSAYREWVLPGINEKPDGGSYFVTVDELQDRELVKGARYLLGGAYRFQVLWFKRDGYSTLEFRREPKVVPDCPLFKDLKSTTQSLYIYRMTPRPDLLEMLMAEIWLLPRVESQTVEMRLRLAVKPVNLVYQLMPEKMLRNELEIRGRRLFENFFELRKSEAWQRAAKSVAVPTSSKAQK